MLHTSEASSSVPNELQSFSESRQTDNPFGMIQVKQYHECNQPMGTLQDPHQREKYTREQLVERIAKYLEIQAQVNQIQTNLRDLYYLAERPDTKSAEFRN